MRIAIDISQIVYETGVSTYVLNLVSNLLKLDKKNEYVLFAGTLRRKQDVLSVFPQARVFPFPPVVADIIWNRLHTLPIERFIGKVDVLHTSDWAEAPSQAFKVTTVHDLAPLLYPNLFPRDIIRNIVDTHKRKLNRVASECKRIIVPSNATRADMVKLGFDESAVRVIPEAVSENFKKSGQDEIDALKKKYRISGDYVLAVGMNPRKNTKRIIESFEKARSGKDMKLVFVGNPKYMKVEEDRNIRIIGHVKEPELIELYSGAKALVYPSLYEGFGQPILEAFSCECPVVTSDLSSMAEVAGDAAVLVDPYDISSIAEGIRKALGAPKALILKGLARIKDFSWEKTAKMTLEVYNEAKL
jgi:glycosyltransferase involved in cell wall biosynthesis